MHWSVEFLSLIRRMFFNIFTVFKQHISNYPHWFLFRIINSSSRKIYCKLVAKIRDEYRFEWRILSTCIKIIRTTNLTYTRRKYYRLQSRRMIYHFPDKFSASCNRIIYHGVQNFSPILNAMECRISLPYYTNVFSKFSDFYIIFYFHHWTVFAHHWFHITRHDLLRLHAFVIGITQRMCFSNKDINKRVFALFGALSLWITPTFLPLSLPENEQNLVCISTFSKY